ncbi:MAG: putative glycosyl hydrolase [Prokaryotic dsDNA virus sp.]|nr:MAG: putative glycosyl hydrolase [Prokaryotic dsDNA virus sp.]|tara:strand:- start:8854 stop:9315 length:462 start_codon:yes stop_codon:yes gene_type:complete
MNFEEAVDVVLKHEGGYNFDYRDPGGETNYGISKRAYPELDIKSLTKGHAKYLYERDYWVKLKCSGLPSSVRLIVFDCGVNQGVNFATRSLQECLKVKVDGIIGPITLEAAEKFKGNLLEDFALKRLERYFSNRNFDIYGKGWLRRLLSTSII